MTGRRLKTLGPKPLPSRCTRVASHTKNTGRLEKKTEAWAATSAPSTTSKQIDYSDETTQDLDQPEIKDTPTIV